MLLTIWSMLGAAVLIILLMPLIYYLDKRFFSNCRHEEYRQLILGILFSVLVVAVLQMGIRVHGSLDNIQDVIPLCTGLIFGVPAGILTGILGAALAFCIQPGDFTVLTIVISLICAGFLGSILRYFLFDDKKSSDFYGFAAGLVMAVLHMLILLLLHIHDLKAAYLSIHMAAIPLMFVSAVTVMVILRLVLMASGVRSQKYHGKKGIAEIFQRWLLICVIVAFSITCIYSWFLQTSLAEDAADNLLRLNIKDVQGDISETSDTELLRIARKVAAQIGPQNYQNDHPGEVFYNAGLHRLMKEFDLTEINLVNRGGINVASTDGSYCGYNMAGGAQSAAFLRLTDNVTEMVQSYQPISSDASISRKYAGVALSDGGFVQVGYGADQSV